MNEDVGGWVGVGMGREMGREMGCGVGEMRLTRGLCWTCWATLG